MTARERILNRLQAGPVGANGSLSATQVLAEETGANYSAVAVAVKGLADAGVIERDGGGQGSAVTLIRLANAPVGVAPTPVSTPPATTATTDYDTLASAFLRRAAEAIGEFEDLQERYATLVDERAALLREVQSLRSQLEEALTAPRPTALSDAHRGVLGRFIAEAS